MLSRYYLFYVLSRSSGTKIHFHGSEGPSSLQRLSRGYKYTVAGGSMQPDQSTWVGPGSSGNRTRLLINCFFFFQFRIESFCFHFMNSFFGLKPFFYQWIRTEFDSGSKL